MAVNTIYQHTLNEPKKWQAALVGSDKKPIYFDCCQCEKHEPVIAGFLSSSEKPEFNQIYTMTKKVAKYGTTFNEYHLALFCPECWTKYQNEHKA